MPVSASVRVQEAEYSVGDNIAKEAMTLKQDIPQEMQSDDLEAIRDGNRTVDGNQGGNTNSTMWSNYKTAKMPKTMMLILHSSMRHSRYLIRSRFSSDLTAMQHLIQQIIRQKYMFPKQEKRELGQK